MALNKGLEPVTSDLLLQVFQDTRLVVNRPRFHPESAPSTTDGRECSIIIIIQPQPRYSDGGYDLDA